MVIKSARRALADSAVALLVACAAIAMFLPPMVTSTVASVPRVVGLALAMAVAMVLHWVWVGIAAKRLGRSAAGWVAGAVLLFPVGGAAALILLAWLSDEATQPMPAASH